jgi:WD40 repeat protein
MFDTFEITIQRKSGDYYPVVSQYSRSGVLLPIRSEGKLRLTPDDLIELTSLGQPKDYGIRLGELLFQGNIDRAFATARSKSDERLRVLLFIEADDAEVKSLRWERLCAPIDGDWNFLRRDQRVPFSLYIPSITDRRFPPIGQRDLRALVLVASPNDSERFNLALFDVAATVASIRSALGNKIPCDVLAHDVEGAIGLPTLNQLCDQLTRQAYTLLHVVCHGQLTKDKTETILYWTTQDNRTEPVPGKLFIDALKQIQGPKGLPHFTFLCTCESASKSADGAFGGFAEQLVRDLGMPAVVAMTEKVTIKTAEALIERFYQQLREHGEVDRALDEATAGLGGRQDIIVPALFSRLGGRPLFSDTLDRPLTTQEIQYGLERFQLLLKERAPVLQNNFEQQREILQRTLKGEVSDLSSTERQERQVALDEINKLAGEVLDLSFNALSLDKPVPDYDTRCPFRGLYPFRLENQDFFFGREDLIQTLQDKLKEEKAQPFLAILGGSGSGKSSLVLAGLIPALQQEEPTLQLAYMTPSYNPLEQLDTTLARVQGHPFVLVIDQFEEVFTLCLDEANRRTWISKLLALVQSGQRVIITMRADFWGECAPYSELKALMQKRQELIAPMNSMELRTAMEKQAGKVGLRFEAGLSNVILDAVQGEPGAMPLLQHALQELWKQRHGRWLRYEEYEKFGGIQKAIAKTAEDFYITLTEEEQKLMGNIFVRLTRLDSQRERDTRQRVILNELISGKNTIDQTKDLVQRLAGEGSRLIVTTLNEKTDKIEVEVAHEALIQYWPRLQSWLNNNRQSLLLRDDIGQAAEKWYEHRQDDDLIHRGGRLEDAENLLELPDFLNELESTYIKACVKLRDRQAKEQKRRVQVLSALVILASIASGFALYQLQQIKRQRVENLATTAQSLLETHPVEAEVNAIVATDSSHSWFVQFPNRNLRSLAEDSLLDVIQGNRERNSLSVESEVTSVAFSPDGKQVVCGSEDGSVHIWNTQTGQQIWKTSQRHEATVTSVAFSPDGKQIVSGSNDSAVHVWDAQTGQQIWKFSQGREEGVTSVAFSPDGKRIVSGSEDRTIRLWDVQTGQQIWQTLPEDQAAVTSVAFSPDGKRIVSGSNDSTVHVWLAQTGQQIWKSSQGHEEAVTSVAFSPDGKRIVSGSNDSTVHLWLAQTGQQIWKSSQGHEEAVTSVAFSPDGKQIVSGSLDETVRLRDAQSGQLIGQSLKGHEAAVTSVAFSPDGKQIVSGSKDKTLRFWDALTNQPLGKILEGHTGQVTSVAFSPKGKQIVSGSVDGTVRLWDALTGRPLGEPLVGFEDGVTTVAFSPDGRQIASGSWDKTIRLWNAQTGQLIGKPLVGHEAAIAAVAFSSNDKQIASGSSDKTIRLWDAQTGQLIGKPLEGHEEAVMAVAFSPDGKQIASGSWDKTIRLWDAQTGQLIGKPLAGHEGGVTAIAFSPDGKQIASGSGDGMIRLWNTQTSQWMDKSLKGHTNQVTAVAFSPDGKQIVSGSRDGTVRLWDAQTGQLLWHPLNR